MADRYFQLHFVGNGGEISLGTITPEQFRYWHNNVKFHRYMTKIDETWTGNRGLDQAELNKNIPPEAHFDRPYHEYCDICKIAGPGWTGDNKVILKEFDKDGELLQEEEHFLVDLEDKGVEARCIATHNSGSESCKSVHYIFGQTFNRGLMGYNQDMIMTGQDGFDFTKMKVSYDNINEFRIFDRIGYDGNTYILTEDSIGKGYNFHVAKGYDLF